MRASVRLAWRVTQGALVLLLLAVPSLCVAAGGGTMRSLIVRVPKPYDSMTALVRSMGGRVNHTYQNVDAIAVSVPDAALEEFMAQAGNAKISKDPMIAMPHSVERTRGRLEAGPLKREVRALSSHAFDPQALQELVSVRPNDYLFNNASINASAFHAAGLYGQGVTVAIIDSGTANSVVVPTLAGRVIGGENFVADDPVTSATSRENGPHGTWVGTVIAANADLGFANSSSIIHTLKKFAPDAIYGDCPDEPATAVCDVPLVGVAPFADLYALKVFDSRGGGAPESRIIAAMDRAITLRHNFNTGMLQDPVSGTGTEDDPYVYDALNIQVVNMSLGGGTLFAGRDLEDQLTVKMLREGIVLTTSAGNDGFGAMTGGSPGSGLGSLTVGATSDATHERIVADLFYVPGAGELYRPNAALQTADFSSRGPTADGRVDPDVVANGTWTFAQGTCDGDPDCLAGAPAYLSWVSGTSFSAPTAAGGAALLREAFPNALPGSIRNAMVAGADPTQVKDGSGPIDQGHGQLDLLGAAHKLSRGIPPFIERSHPSPIVENNIRKLGFRAVPFHNNVYSTHVRDLKPGQVQQFFVESDPFTDEIDVEITNVTPQLPPDEQNQLFGDDVYFKIVDAPTSFQDRNITDFVASDTAYTFDNPQTGLVRVALQGDWTNAGRVSADVKIRRARRALGFPSGRAFVHDGDTVPFEVTVPSDVDQLVLETHFLRNWGVYPTSDVDMILIDPDGNVDLDGATLASPERAVVDAPTPGVWTVLVDAFALPTDRDAIALYARADGKRLAAHR
jgi:subtilisin family serine protease